MKTQSARKLALIGYLGLLIWIPVWHLWLSPPKFGLSPWLTFSIWFIPLLFPLRGMLKGDPYTHAWSSYVVMFYFLHSLTLVVADENERWLAVVEFIFAACYFTGNVYYAKYRGQELGLSIRKKKKKKSA